MIYRAPVHYSNYLRKRVLATGRQKKILLYSINSPTDKQQIPRKKCIVEKSQILKHWAEHFRSVLNCSAAISDAAIDRLPQVDTNNDLDLLPSLPETILAVQQISNGKAPGSDANHRKSTSTVGPG
ncbi:unnamed protein product [Schistocephalus solidus]|uniref:Uncharacterized protein n=1 Tax=Schistocephalus solidus TaxID=70667 RepID=A0A183SDZ1_SCHSO|nr:unnamed protein product [Schistocephalus solidus]